MPRTPAEPPVGTGTARERLSELAETIGAEKLDRYQDVLARLEPRQLDALVARLERAQSWDQVAKVVGQDSADDARATVTEALCGLARADASKLEELARAVAERSTIDWPARFDQANDEHERRIIEQLRLADEVAEACWSRSTSPKRLGDFEILRELGRGGMGIVYEARQLSLNRRVALKVLPPALGLSPQATKRFEREARAAAKLHHTNIVPVHFIGEQDGYHFYAMDVIDGQSLDHILEDVSGGQPNPLLEATVTRAAEELPEKTASPTSTGGVTTSSTSLSDSAPGGRKWFDVAAKLVAEVAEALQYAHGRGIIHRDIKPANLMLSAEGYLCVTDFGLARMIQEPGMTVSGSLLGTPAYMSPEQIAAGRITVDHRTSCSAARPPGCWGSRWKTKAQRWPSTQESSLSHQHPSPRSRTASSWAEGCRLPLRGPSR